MYIHHENKKLMRIAIVLTVIFIGFAIHLVIKIANLEPMLFLSLAITAVKIRSVKPVLLPSLTSIGRLNSKQYPSTLPVNTVLIHH